MAVIRRVFDKFHVEPVGENDPNGFCLVQLNDRQKGKYANEVYLPPYLI